jgi:hypothetical protein
MMAEISCAPYILKTDYRLQNYRLLKRWCLRLERMCVACWLKNKIKKMAQSLAKVQVLALLGHVNWSLKFSNISDWSCL